MSDFTQLFQQMMAQGQAMAKAMNPALERMDPAEMAKAMPAPTKDMLEMSMGRTFNPGGLDAKTRLLVVLAAQVVQGAQNEAVLETTVAQALTAGATAQEVAEVVAQMAMFGGVPAMTKAMAVAQRAIATHEGKESEG